MGIRLYGDDFTPEQIKRWYEEESEGYANLGGKDKTKYRYGYHEINKLYGFSKLRSEYFENVLGFGAAWGYEFEPIIAKIGNLSIIEPSDNLKSARIGKLTPNYIKPEIYGNLKFADNTFDLITCFSTLHHIPNVSFVVKELVRVLKPSGYLLIREPIVSMGDWTVPRGGLTKNERGIPDSFFDKLFKGEPVHVISKEYFWTGTSFIQRNIDKLLKTPIYSYRIYCIVDKLLSRLLKRNTRYHAEHKLDKFSPSTVFFVIRKAAFTNKGGYIGYLSDKK